jgi:hypothetical protein
MPELRRRRLAVWNLLVCLVILFPFARAANPSISIQNQPAYSGVRPCVQDCLYCGEFWFANCLGGNPGLNNFLSAQSLDALYCRSDLQSSASSFLTGCMDSLCDANSVDLSDGISLYNGYCSIGGASLNNYPTTTLGGGGTITLSASPGSAPTVVIYSTVISGSTRITISSCEWSWYLVVLGVAVVTGTDLY